MSTEDKEKEKINKCPNMGCEKGKQWSFDDKVWVICPFCNPY